MGKEEVRFAYSKPTHRSPKTGFKVHKGDFVDVVEFEGDWALLKGGHWVENINNGKPLLRKADGLMYRVRPDSFAAMRHDPRPTGAITRQLPAYTVVEVSDVNDEWLQLKSGDYVQWKKGDRTFLEPV